MRGVHIAFAVVTASVLALVAAWSIRRAKEGSVCPQCDGCGFHCDMCEYPWYEGDDASHAYCKGRPKRDRIVHPRAKRVPCGLCDGTGVV